MESSSGKDVEKQAQYAPPPARVSTGSIARIDAPTKDTVETDDTKTEKPDDEYFGYAEDHW